MLIGRGYKILELMIGFRGKGDWRFNEYKTIRTRSAIFSYAVHDYLWGNLGD